MKILPNGIAVIADDTHISKWVRESGRLDHDQNMLPVVLRQINKGGIVLDVGAYIGDHTIAYARAVGDAGHVYAFEPNPQAFECLSHSTQELHNCSIYNMGLAAEKGTRAVMDEVSNKGMVYLSTNPGDIVVGTIDSFELQRVDFIKIDVEGMEPEVLAGARETIERCCPVLLIEVNEPALARSGYTPNDIFSFLSQLGYGYRNIYPHQPMTGIQFDILATKK